MLLKSGNCMTVLSKHCLCFRSGDSLNTVLVRIFVLCHVFRKDIVLEFLNFVLYKIIVLCHDFHERYRSGVLIFVLYKIPVVGATI